MIGLRAAVEEEFANLEGRFDYRHDHLGLRIVNKYNAGVEFDHKPGNGRDLVAKAAYNKTWRNTNRELDMTRKRMARLKSKIAEWKTDAIMILIGRDISSVKDWESLLTNPVTEDEKAAVIDFVYFLNHRRVLRHQIASMLQIKRAVVDEYLKSRGISK